MADDVTNDVVVALARVEGEIRGLRETFDLHITALQKRLEREVQQGRQDHASMTTRLDRHHDRIDVLEARWDRARGWVAGIAGASGLLSGLVILLIQWIIQWTLGG